ncbi:Fanconi-associated nuclease 1 like [Glycine soja]|uniref:Fanconi-associated nuclease n=1 Tax=Glycine soja TaxID=3848 RepID=A0A0B2Q2L1_GLYSO|nr:Fanconi-associated nuclease 1 like [Glycine soja]
MVLSGRESLIRLIGKRRRFLPNRHSILSDPNPNPNPACNDVQCPVCGRNLPGDNHHINSHLDACLSQSTPATKRKFSQRTLLQLNFTLSNSKPKFHNLTHDSNTSPVPPPQHNESEEEEQVPEAHETDLDSTISTTSSSSLPSNNGVPGITLETFIVGRKYTDNPEEICAGTAISLLRDPQNVKDLNAIKVVSVDAVCYKSLGFIPHELAQCLSPLIDNYGLGFQGHVTSVPKHSLDIVPIQITCHRTSDGESKYADETFKCLWKNAQCVVEFASRSPPSSVKYQLNFYISNNVSSMVLIGQSHSLYSQMTVRGFLSSYTLEKCQLSLKDCVIVHLENEYIHSIEDANQPCESNVNDILNVLSVSELHEIWCILLKKSGGHQMKKQHLISSILFTGASVLWPQLSTMILDRTVFCIRISSKAESLMWRIERLFFLNGEQDLSSFLLVDMGKIVYPAYNCIISEPIFSNRNNLLSYEEAIEVAQIMDEALDANKTDVVLRCIKIAESCVSTDFPIQCSTSESVSSIRRVFTASWVYSKVVTVGISFLERERRYIDAINLLKWLLNVFTCDVKRGYWTLRLSVDLEYLGCTNESLQIAENGLLDPWIRAGSRMALQRRVLHLGKQPRHWNVPSFSSLCPFLVKLILLIFFNIMAISLWLVMIPVFVQGRPLNSELGEKNRYYNEEGKQCGVEELALHYYARDGGGWLGVHAESGIWLTIFGLLMWDVIYADVPNVFYTRFQNAPLDFGTDSFYTVRKSSIEQICDGMAEEFLIKSWETHIGTACRGVNWDCHPLDELHAVVTCVGGICLASLCKLLAQDYRSWSSGMPDLLLWRFHGEYSGEAKLVEVKGPKDRLSEQQRAWLLLLMDSGFTIEVCKVKPL